MNLISRRKFFKALAGGAACAAMAPGSAMAQAGAIKLPPPKMDGPGTLMQALAARKSTREFSPKPLAPELLSGLLWAAFGINRPDSGKRTAPSALNLQELDIYVASADGLFLYEPAENRLKKISGSDLRGLTGKQGFVKEAPVNLVYVSDHARMARVEEPMREKLSWANAGFIGQNVYLFCAAHGLATVVRGHMDAEALSKAMGLGAAQHLILAQTVGYPK